MLSVCFESNIHQIDFKDFSTAIQYIFGSDIHLKQMYEGKALTQKLIKIK